MFKADHLYKVHWEITDLCNLKCPMCPRTDILNHCQPVKEIQNTQFFLDDVKKFFPDKLLKKIKRIDFCGNFGDPCIAQDFYEICEFLVANYGITLMVSTNGTMRNPSWWKKMGALLADTGSWFELHIDGLRDTNHLYRIGANWNKIMENTKAFIAGGARADWHYILFKHNQHQVDQAHMMAHQMGFKHFVPTDSGRFPDEGKYRYLHPNGDWANLEQATISVRHEIKHLATAAASDCTLSPKNNPASSNSINGITCKSASLNRFFLDSRGYVTPCCWVSNRDIKRPGDMLKAVSISGKENEIYNIRNRPIEEILSDDLFSEIFPNLWRSGKLATCSKKCGKKLRNYKFKIKL